MKRDFQTRLGIYKQAIDADIASYAQSVRQSTLQQFGRSILEAETDIFLDLLSRGGKRIRGTLVIVGYEMCGGQDRPMILQAARAIEMLHAGILIIDDIQDRSALRRGQLSAHEMIAAYHRRKKFKGDAAHAGISLALNAAVASANAAQVILANLDVDPELRLKALSIIGQTMVVTAHGQSLDFINELVDSPTEADIERVLEWKTARYTITNPLHVGMVLAGADCQATDALTPYGLNLGKAFQIIDDISGIYGSEKELGKKPGDDLREGKGTLIMLYALQHAEPADRAALRSCLGNPRLTAKDLARCRQIIKTSGALDYARSAAARYVDAAQRSLDPPQGLWSQAGTDFLYAAAQTLQDRAASSN